MKENRKNVRSLWILLVVFSMLITGCGTSPETSKEEKEIEEVKEELITVPLFSEDVKLTLGQFDFDMDWTKDSEQVDSEFSESVNKLCVDMCDFFRTEMGFDYDVKNVRVYLADVTSNMHNAPACYWNGAIYVDRACLKDKLNGKFKCVMTHELIHLLNHAKHSDDLKFAIKKGQEDYLGVYLEEAFVESLNKKYLLARCKDVKKDDIRCGYTNIRMLVDLLQLAVPDTYRCFYDNDVKRLKKELDNIANQHVFCIGSPFEKWSSFLDLIYTQKEDISEYMSIELSFLAVITPQKNTNEFVSILKEEDLDGNQFIPYMY